MARSRIEQVPVAQHAAWLIDRPDETVSSHQYRVGAVLPGGFPAMLRLFHPFVPWTTAAGSPVAAADCVSWAELARNARATFDPALTWDALRPVLPETEAGRPFAVWEGDLEPGKRRALLQALPVKLDEPVFVYFGLAAVIRGGEPVVYAVRTPEDVELVCATVDRELGEHVPGPEYLWPESRAWVVNSDYDLVSTYVATDQSSAFAIQADSLLEVVEVTAETPLV